MHLPRIGSEVLVDFLEGDIDRPVIVAQLYNGADTPPFAAGVDSGVNHPGVISGLHSQGLDGAGVNQLVFDDAPGQPRVRLLSSYAGSELGLGHLIQQGASDANRGAWRGSGFELLTGGWASVRAAQGLLLSTHARAGTYGSAQSTQMDAAETVGLLKGATDLAQRLNDAAVPGGALKLASHDKGQCVDKFIQVIDPSQQGKHEGAVNGQEAKKPDGSPVEAFAEPVVVMDTPATTQWAAEAGIAAFAGQDFTQVSHGDTHLAAAHTFASVSGGTTSYYTLGEMKLTAANGPVSIRAHTDALRIHADQDVTLISVNDEIRIQAKTKIELIAGKTRIALDGPNIEFAMPGQFQVKAATHAFLGAGSRPATLPPLPDTRVKLFDQQVRAVNELTGEPIADMPYKLTTATGESHYGKTDKDGRTIRIATVNQEAVKVEWGALPPTSKG